MNHNPTNEGQAPEFETTNQMTRRTRCGCALCSSPHAVCIGYRHPVGPCDCEVRNLLGSCDHFVFARPCWMRKDGNQ